MKKKVLLILGILTAVLAQATVPFTVFQADFEGAAATDATDGSLTTNNLNSGTAWERGYSMPVSVPSMSKWIPLRTGFPRKNFQSSLFVFG